MHTLTVNPTRLSQRIAELAQIGARPDGGVCRLALTDEDKAARDRVVQWMKDLGLQVHIDQVGNLIGLRPGKQDTDPVVMGSHIDTVPTGGRYDGAAGVLAALEVLETLNDGGIQTRRPLAVVAFTNEEGTRYPTELPGSQAFCGFISPEEAYADRGLDGSCFGDELKRIGYLGDYPCGSLHPFAYLEYHIEQGPVLDHEGLPVGVVEAITGYSWQQFTLCGEANHAGTTPTRLRHDAGLVAGRAIAYLRQLAEDLGENQRATCGSVAFTPNAINVIPSQAVFTADLRNPDAATLAEAERRLAAFLEQCAREEGVTVEAASLARIQPEPCHPVVIEAVTDAVEALGYPYRRMVSGAVHDALVLARRCPTGMIFVPSQNGLSHNPAEYTAPEDLAAGANVLLGAAVKLGF